MTKYRKMKFSFGRQSKGKPNSSLGLKSSLGMSVKESGAKGESREAFVRADCYFANTEREIAFSSNSQCFFSIHYPLTTACEAVSQRILDRVLNDVRILRAEELLQARGVHRVRTDHVRQSSRRNGRNSAVPQEAQNRATGSARNALDLGVGNLGAALNGNRLAAASDIQDSHRRIGFGPVQKEDQQSRDVIHMHELELLLQILLATRQHQRKPFALSAHAGRAFALAKRCAAQRSHHVVLHAGAGKDVRANDVSTPIAQTFGAIADHLIALALVDGIRQSMRPQRSVFLYRPRSFGSISRDAAGEDELIDVSAGAIDDARRLHDASGSRHVDLPHALDVKHAAAQRIEDEGEMDDRGCAGPAQQLNQRPTRGFAPQVNLLEARQRKGNFGWAHIHAHHVK